MSAKPIGELFATIVARTAAMRGFQDMIGALSTPESRKDMIMTARMGDLITDEETTLLLQVYQLETA